MIKIFIRFSLLFLLFQGVAYAYIDSDFDGVSDKRDACPNTPFSDLVDAKGCSVKKVALTKELARLSLILGTSYSSYTTTHNQTKTISQSLELDYEIKKIKLQLTLAHHNAINDPYSTYNDASFGDTRIAISYHLSSLIPDISLFLQGGLSIPNYKGVMKNNKLDIFSGVSAHYFIGKSSLFTGATYTFVGDSDTKYASYQNTLALNFGLGYALSPSLYSALSYTWSQSSLKSEDSTRALSWFSYLNINPTLFSTFSLSKDLDADVESSRYGINLGYRI